MIDFRKIFQGSGSYSSVLRTNGSEGGHHGLLSRWLSSHYHGGVHDEKSVARHTVNLMTSTIKVDADQTDLRFCFRIISPSKMYTLQVPEFQFEIKMTRINTSSNLAGKFITFSFFFLNMLVQYCVGKLHQRSSGCS